MRTVKVCKNRYTYVGEYTKIVQYFDKLKGMFTKFLLDVLSFQECTEYTQTPVSLTISCKTKN